jgi:hypothetical protein
LLFSLSNFPATIFILKVFISNSERFWNHASIGGLKTPMRNYSAPTGNNHLKIQNLKEVAIRTIFIPTYFKINFSLERSQKTYKPPPLSYGIGREENLFLKS